MTNIVDPKSWAPVNQSHITAGYPDYFFTGYTLALGAGQSILTLPDDTTPITVTPADFDIIETVGATDINDYTQVVVDQFQIGNYGANANFGTGSYFRVGAGYTSGGVKTVTSATYRIVSTELLKAGLSIGAAINLKVIGIANNPTAVSTIYTITSVTATYKLMNTAGALTTIGSVNNADVHTHTTLSNVPVAISKAIDLSGTFAPVVTAADDRFVVEIEFAGTMNLSVPSQSYLGISFGSAGSDEPMNPSLGASDFDAYRPLQATVS